MREVMGEESPLREWLAKPRPVDVRYVTPLTWEAHRDPALRTSKTERVVPLRRRTARRPAAARGAAAYASDFTLVDTVLLTHGLAWGASNISGA